MKDLMLDIETLGTNHNSVITQIGACYFNRYTGEIGETFLANIKIQTCLDRGLTINSGTLEWWFTQENISWLEDSIDLRIALMQLVGFANKAKSVWSHSTFDIPILINAYKASNARLPFHYRSTRDIRTLVDLSGLDYNKEKKDKTHNALEDCLYQVKYCVECFNKIKE